MIAALFTRSWPDFNGCPNGAPGLEEITTARHLCRIDCRTGGESMLAKIVFVAVAVLATVSSARADWVYRAQADLFTDKQSYVAYVANGGSQLGFVCDAQGDFELRYFSSETLSEKNLEHLQFASLVARVDGGAVITMTATATRTAQKKLTLITRDKQSVEIARSIAGAKDGVAAAVGYFGQRYDPKEFDVRGAGKAIAAMFESCGRN